MIVCNANNSRKKLGFIWASATRLNFFFSSELRIFQFQLDLYKATTRYGRITVMIFFYKYSYIYTQTFQ